MLVVTIKNIVVKLHNYVTYINLTFVTTNTHLVFVIYAFILLIASVGLM